MVGLTKEQRAAKAAAKEQQAPEVADNLVAMEKDGAVLEVHPSCVPAHEKAGWKVKA